MTMRPRRWRIRGPWVLAACLVSAVLPRLGADPAPERGVLLLFSMALDADTPKGGPDGPALSRIASESLSAALQSAGYEVTIFNPGSPTVARALKRDRSLDPEEVARPEITATARKLAALHGARGALFPRVTELALDQDAGRARADLGLRVVSAVGAERQLKGTGAVQLRPERRSPAQATQLLQQALETAARDLARTFTTGDPAGAEAPAQARGLVLYQQGLQALQENQAATALPLLERAVAIEPDNFDYRMALADAFERNGHAANALMEYRQAVTLRPGSIDVRVRLADAYARRNMLPQATAELRRAEQLEPENPTVRAALMDLYLRTGKVEEALAECRRVAAERPKDVSVRLTLGDLLSRRDQLEEAQAAYQEAARLDPNSAAPHEKLAAVYRRRGMHREALKELLLAQRTATGSDDVGRYRAISQALDTEASELLDQAAKTAAGRKAGTLTREDAYAALRPLAERADALSAEMVELKAPSAVNESHRRRAYAYSLIAQCLFLYLDYYETDRQEQVSSADLLHAQAAREIQRARDAMPPLGQGKPSAKGG